MNSPIHIRVLRPDGTEAARGPLRADVTADAEREAGLPWWLLELDGWRVEMVPAEGRDAA